MLEIINNRRQFSSFNFFSLFFHLYSCVIYIYIYISKYQMNDKKKILIKIFVYCLNLTNPIFEKKKKKLKKILFYFSFLNKHVSQINYNSYN